MAVSTTIAKKGAFHVSFETLSITFAPFYAFA